MSDFNKFIGIGRLTRDPELKALPSGKSLCRFTVAMSDVWKENGETKKKTLWANCVAFGKTAEYIEKYLRKGAQVAIEAKLEENEFTDKEGVKRKSMSFVVSSISSLGSAKRNDDPDAAPSGGDPEPSGGDVDPDDIPF